MSIRLLQGDCREVLKTLPDSSVDSCITDPPYELGFMGKAWDSTGISNDPAMWFEVLRVLKPGGYLLAFSGTRTYHRMVCAIEDAGFEIRDQIGWVYGSGFPKSHDVSKAIDAHLTTGRSDSQMTGDGRSRLPGQHFKEFRKGSFERAAFVPATEAARKWAGWGTALKPAWEPICMARKPLISTVAANVLEHGVGAINVDGCRVAISDDCARHPSLVKDTAAGFGKGAAMGGLGHAEGRWPANVIHDGSDEVLAAFPQAPGQQRAVGPEHGEKPSVNTFGDFGPRDQFNPRGDTGSAARFFYTAKASAHDRNEGTYDLPAKVISVWGGDEDDLTCGKKSTKAKGNHHPTVKPTDLMRYLCRLVTPAGGSVLDPFAGSGSTLKAAELEGFAGIGIELQAEYIEIARRRIASDAPLFAEVTA